MRRKNLELDMAALGALAEPHRMHIVEILRRGPLTVGEIAERTGLRQPQASKHLKVLSDGGILKVTPVANRRLYQLRPEPFQKFESWAQSFRDSMEDRFNQLDEYLQKVQKGEKK